MESSVQRTSGPTEQLCEFVADTEYDDIPDDVVAHAKLMIRDAIGVSLAATETEPFERARAAKVREPESEHGVARVPGTSIEGTLGDVGLLDGILAHALDFDDVHPDMGGHPSSPVLSALLPTAEYLNASGKEFLRAFVLGTEAEISLADVLNPGHYERGWHPTAILGTVGAAVAVSALYDHDSETLQQTVGIASSQASGIKANFGTMTKSYHVGRAASSAIEAARLAAEGFTSNPDALEAEFGGFCDLFRGTSEYEFADHFETLGDPWKIVTPRVGFKPYPCCGSTHGAIDAALEVRKNLNDNVSVQDIASIEIEEHPRRLGHTNRPDPQTQLDAKFSVQYCVIAALQDGDIWFDDFAMDAVEDDQRRACLSGVTVQERAGEFAEDEWGARVTVTLGDGIEESARVACPKGSAENPMSSAELKRKYHRCATRLLSADRADESADVLDRLEEVEDITELIDSIVSGSPSLKREPSGER
ncbi:MmgE/PrpD family protein [Halobacterium noricense]|uniref:MmgE/PrpD family protein n=1 Tax=Halobacterium noricense TaxID=223182 RepID=UPI001E4B918B|nr:MmgE/PrpD family protein [Halobacterium noricense]UHH24025.1 MmgE/PrpD family protein [Halobacterium noricense]